MASTVLRRLCFWTLKSRETRQFARKGDAQTFLDGVRGDLARGVYIDPAEARVLFRDYAESWRAAQVHRRSTATQAETYLRLHACPTLGRRPIGAILRSEIQAWVKSVRAPWRRGRSRSSTGGCRPSSKLRWGTG